MKFNFDNSRYAKFWESREAAQALRIFINDSSIISSNFDFWKSQFEVDPFLQPRNNDGTATFSASVRKRDVPYMLDMRAPLGDSQPRDKQGLETYTGSIPDFIAKGYVEQAMEREARVRMFEEYFGNDSEILNAFADDLQVMFDEGNSTISNMAAQLLSTGKVVYNYGTGIQSPIQKAPIPAANFKTAGTLAWSNASCKLIDQMMAIEQDYRDSHDSKIALKWQITETMFRNVFLKNAQVIAYIKNWRLVNDKAYTDNMAINKAMFEEAFRDNEMISPIEVVCEKQKDGLVGSVHGWADGIAVLRPAGYAGKIKRASLLDLEMFRKYGSSVIAKVSAQSGIFTVVNTTLNNGNYKEWHTDLMVACVPTLDEFEDHVIVDTTSADE